MPTPRVGDLQRRAAVLGTGADGQPAAAPHRVQRVLDDVGQRPAQRRRSRNSCGISPDSCTSKVTRVGQRARYGAVTSSIDLPARRVGDGRAIGEDAKLENSPAICRSSRDLRQDGVDAPVEDAAERPAGGPVHAAQVLGRQLDGRQRVLDVVRHLARHVGPRRQPVRALQFGALVLQVGRHLVEVVHQAPQLVGGGGVAMRASRSPRAMRRVARVSRFTGSATRSAVT